MTGLRFGVLGPLAVWRDGVPLTVPSGRRRAVLACLALHAGRPVAADVLVDAAWGAGRLPADARASLHTVLSRIRGVVGEDTVRLHPAGYLLDIPPAHVDAYEFVDLTSRAELAAPDEAERLLGTALDLWRGPAYVEFADRDFAVLESQRLELLRLDAVEARAAIGIEADRASEAVPALEAMVAAQPLREEAQRLLITALHDTGRSAEAVARYREYRAWLGAELGLEPGAALVELEARILGETAPHQRSPALGDAEVTSRSWLDTSTAFLGRDVDRAGLVAAMSTDRLVTVTGVGGVGKTRLVAETLLPGDGRSAGQVAVVELAQVPLGRVESTVAETLGLHGADHPVRAELVDYLSITGGVLVLDQCEHLLGEVARFVEVVLSRCPRVRVVATSRRRLGVPSERVLPLTPFPVTGPESTAERSGFSTAAYLFTDRVRRLRPAFALDEQNAQAVANICRLVDGVPLALELAASRAAVLGLEPVHDQLRQGGLRVDATDRRPRELDEVVDWSYRLLTAGQCVGRPDTGGDAGVRAGRVLLADDPGRRRRVALPDAHHGAGVRSRPPVRRRRGRERPVRACRVGA